MEDGKGGEFAWRDGPFLAALRAGHWIVLDEARLPVDKDFGGKTSFISHVCQLGILVICCLQQICDNLYCLQLILSSESQLFVTVIFHNTAEQLQFLVSCFCLYILLYHYRTILVNSYHL